MRKGLPVVCALLASVLIAVLGAQSDGWQKATPGYQFQFPRDHASHPDYKLEWWYYTGNVSAPGGRAFGYQLTFFRVGIEQTPVNSSRWAVRDLFMTHFAVTDIGRTRYQFAEQLHRAGIGWAGADTDRYRVWNEGWEATLDANGTHRLQATHAGMGIDLRLDPGKPPVDQGTSGVSQKGSAPGNASHYYSLTRMPTVGTLTLDGKAFEVRGLSWMDHEFGTSFLEPEQQGWNWFALQLDDNTELMLYEFRRPDARRDEHSSGSIIDQSGRRTRLSVADFVLEAGERWTSPRSGATYPIDWTLRVPAHGLDLRVRASLSDQELVTIRSRGVTYWEGAVHAEGTRRGRPVRGRGYLEMTGYAGTGMSTLLH
jgi:predicted secreted hydrolase